jgi:hypothetical protein
MSNREDETWLNINGHADTCSCPDCLKKRKRIKYPYPAELECPVCGNISMYYSDQLAIFKCNNEKCKVEGKTLQEIAVKKAQTDKRLKDLWNL